MSGELIPVAEALARVLAAVPGPTEMEGVPVAEAGGRTLAEDLAALRTQPPFDASAMDGYAVATGGFPGLGARLRVVGESAAGRRHPDRIGPGEAVRIFTGAPVPEGADAILLQEDADRDGEWVSFREAPAAGRHVRGAGGDFRAGDRLLAAGTRLDPRRHALAAAMGHADVAVRRRPRVAILATGDELVPPGAPAGPDQIIATNSLALAGIAREAGAEAVDLGIAGDTFAALEAAIARAREGRADLLVTLGGASVGEHDLVQSALRRQGLELGFWRVAIRPGKPLLHGRLGPLTVIGLPGNPVSSIVCALLFVVPAIRALLGDPGAGADRTEPARLGAGLPENDGRQDYMRARLDLDPVDGMPVATAARPQDSSMLGLLAGAGALIVRPPRAPAARAGDACRILRLDRMLV